jgi:hypothetical protein
MPGSRSAAAFGGHTPALIADDFLIVTPLFHTSFPLDLMQVNFLPAEVTVAPALAHLLPGLVAACAGAIANNETAIRTARTLRMSKY